MSRLKLTGIASGLVNRLRKSNSKMKFNNYFDVEHVRKGIIIAKFRLPNDIVNEGKNIILNAMFNDGTVTSSGDWVLGLISNASYSALAASDVMNSHAGWTEFTGYSEANRLAWGQGTSSAQSVTNSSVVTFSINATGTVKGLFLCNEDTKGGTSGNLWATGLFPSDLPVVNTDEIRATYTVNC